MKTGTNPARKIRHGWTLAALAAAVLTGVVLTGAATAQVSQQTNQQALPAPAPIPAGSQFGPFATPPYDFDDVRGEWVNLEAQLVKPILVTRDEQHVVFANVADDRVVVMTSDLQTTVAEIVLGQGITALVQRPPGPVVADGDAVPAEVEGEPVLADPHEIWVSVRHQSSVAVIDTVTWRLKNLLRPPITHVMQGARRAAVPGGIAFNANGTKAYVAATDVDKLMVYDASQKTWLQAINLSLTHNNRTTALNDPLAVVAVGNDVYVVSHLSGNQTIVDPTNTAFPVPSFPQHFGPDKVIVSDLTNDPNRSLPDYDVMRIDTTTDTVVSHQTGVGSTLFGIVHHPGTGRLVVSGFESRNGEFIGEGSFPNGQVTRNRIVGFVPGSLPSSYIVVTTENLGPSGDDVVMPTDMVVDSRGSLYVAGYASANIGVWASNGLYLGSLPTDGGPRGLAYARGLERVYVLNRAAATVAYYDVSAGLPGGPAITPVALPDPTFDRVKAGRQVFLDPTHSGAGTTGCFSCHQDARKDGLGWVLAKFFDMNASFNNQSNPPPNWKDKKGVKTTQDLRSIGEVPPYHWRGEQPDLDSFNDAFEGLLKGPKLGTDALALMKDYAFSTVYPPNPFERMNRTFSTAGSSGATSYLTICNNCHFLPTGTDAGITESLLGAGHQAITAKTAQLRGLWTKLSDLANVDNTNPNPTDADLWPVTGFAMDNEGQVDHPEQFIALFFAGQNPNLANFVREIDTGLAPFTMYSELLDASTVATELIGTYMIPQANAQNGDLAARGRLRLAGTWQDVGLVWDRNAQVFVSDSNAVGNFAFSTLRTMAWNGDAELLFMGVPLCSGERVGVDRDRDGVFDGDEVAQGLNPKNPDSDRDGLWDSYDPQPLQNPNTILPVGAPQVDPLSINVEFFNTNAVKITYETDTFSPTRVEFGTTTAYGNTSGDPFPLAGSSNHWKRHHTVFLRPQPNQGLLGLEDGTTYHFRIHTQGQNGQTTVTGDLTAATKADILDPNVRIASVSLVGVRSGSQVTWTASVQVTDNHGNVPSSPVSLVGRFTHFAGTNLMSQPFSAATSDTLGVITYTDTTSFQSLGDVTFFDIPQETPLVSPDPFLWPEGPSCKKELAP